MERELRHHRIDSDRCAKTAGIEVWDDDGDDHITLCVEPPNDPYVHVDISPAKARALAAILIMAAENCERRNPTPKG